MVFKFFVQKKLFVEYDRNKLFCFPLLSLYVPLTHCPLEDKASISEVIFKLISRQIGLSLAFSK